MYNNIIMLSIRVTWVLRYIILITYIKVITYNNNTIHYDTLDIAVLDQTIKEAQLRDAAIPNSHNLHSTIAKNLLKYTDLKEELIRK